MILQDRSHALRAIALGGLAFALPALPALAAPWQPYGLADAHQSPIATHASVSGQVVTASAISLDGGAHWRMQSVGSRLVAARSEFPVLFVVGTPTQIFWNAAPVPEWSPDEGRSWAPVPFINPTRADSGFGYAIGGVNPADPQEVVTFFGGALSRTANGGLDWTFEVMPFHATRVTVDWVARRIYASRLDGFAARALDSTGPWIAQAPFFAFDALGGVVVAWQGSTLTRSTDGGASFQPVGANLGPVNACAIAFAPSAPTVVYAIDCINNLSWQVLRSADAGATWTRGGLADAGVATLAVDAIQPLRLWMDGAAGLQRSDDGGVTVQRVPRSTGSLGIARGVLFDAVDPQRQWLTGSVVRTQDGGATWTQVDDDGFSWSPLWSSRARSNVILGSSGGGTFNKTALSVDGGETWVDKIVVSGKFGSTPRMIVDGPNAGEVYVLVKVGDPADERVYASFNDGESFEQRAPIPAQPLSASASRTGPSIFYIGTDVGASAIGLFRSTDQGATLSAVATIPFGGAVSAVAVAPSSASTVYLGYKTPNPYAILRSVDGGATWQTASSGLGTGAIMSIAVDPAMPSTAYAAQYGSGVFRTTDGGTTWVALDEGLRGAARNVTAVTIDPRNAQRLFLSTDAGQFVLDLADGPPLGDRRAIEYYHAAFNHYFVSADLDEIAGLDAGVFEGWARTGEGFRVAEGDTPANLPVCRFFGVGFAPLSSHFYTPYPAECDIVKADPKWLYEKIAFGLALPDAVSHGCPPQTRPLFRLWNVNRDGAPNHRYTTSMVTFDLMRNQEWIFEGEKETRVFACVPD